MRGLRLSTYAVATVLTASGAVVAVTASPAGSLPAVCSSTADNVYRWTGGGLTNAWGDPLNWAHGIVPSSGVPNDDKNNNTWDYPEDPADTNDTVVCLSDNTADDAVVIDDDDGHGAVWVRELYVDGAFTVTVTPQAGLFVHGTSAVSTLGPLTTLDVTTATFGGQGTVLAQGTVRLTATPSQVAALSTDWIGEAANAAYTGETGLLVIDDGATLAISGGGVALRLGYQLDVRGRVVVGPGAYLAADWGTRTRLLPGASGVGTLDFQGDGGYYQGFLDADLAGAQGPPELLNSGLLTKTSGTGSTVIDAAYSELGGAVRVLTGRIVLPDGDVRTAVVAPGAGLSTGACAPRDPGAPCVAVVDANDPRTLSVTIPANNGADAAVELREDVPAAGVAFDGVTKITGLRGSRTAYARIEFADNQQGAAAVSNDRSSLDTVGVGSEPGAGVPTCLGSGVPPHGAVSCVDRRGLSNSTRVVAGVLYTVVHSIADTRSRWIVRREGADVAAPTLYGKESQRSKLQPGEAKPVLVKGLRCSEACRLSGVDGLLVVRAQGKKLKLKLKGSTAAAADKTVRLELKLSPQGKRRLKASGAAKGKATVLVKAKDRSGNAVMMRVRIRLT